MLLRDNWYVGMELSTELYWAIAILWMHKSSRPNELCKDQVKSEVDV